MIDKIRVVGGVAVVMATIDFNPLREMKELANKLETLGFKGEVLFDLLALNGLAENRFVSITFDGHRFNRATLAVESSVSPELKSEQDTIAKSDIEFLRSTVLSRDEVEEFMH